MGKEKVAARPSLLEIGKTGLYVFENLERNPETEGKLIDEIKQETQKLKDLDRRAKVFG